MKLLLCSPVVGVSVSNPGGIAIWEQNIMGYYLSHQDGIEIDVQSCDRTRYINENTSKLRRLCAGVSDYVRIIKEIRGKLKKNHYDAIHVCSTAAWSSVKDYVIFKIAKHYGTKTILHYHFGRIPGLIKSNNWEWWLIKKALSVTNRIIVIDKMSYNALKDEGYDNVYEVANPLFESVTEAITKYQGIARVNNRVLFAGRVFRKKGVYELVEACAGIPGIQLRMVGYADEIDKKALTKLANYGEWLTFVGGVSHDEVIKEMLECDVFVLPSYTEGFPNAIIESMACGTPTIATPVGAIPEMLDLEGEECGVCVPPKDVNSLRNAIIGLLAAEDKKKLYKKRSIARVNHEYTIDRVWKSLCSIWKN